MFLKCYLRHVSRYNVCIVSSILKSRCRYWQLIRPWSTWSAEKRMHEHRPEAFSWRPVSTPFPENSQFPTQLFQELHTLMAVFFSVTQVVTPTLHIRLLQFFWGDNKPYPEPKSIRLTPHTLSALPTRGTSTEPAVASADHKRVFKALSASLVPGVQLHHHLVRTSPVPANFHADVFSATQ